MADGARQAAFEALLETEKEKAYSNLALTKALAKNRDASPSFTREIVYETLKNMLLIDNCLDRLVPSGIKKVGPREKCLLRMGVCQLAFMDSVPDYAAISETVTLARRVCRGREGFINGVLRSFGRNRGLLYELPPRESDTVGYLSLKYSFARWITENWLKAYGEEKTEELMAAANERPELTVRINPLLPESRRLKERLREKGFAVREACEGMLAVRGENLLATEEYGQGLFSVQDRASFEVCKTLDAKAGELVIDICGAPGGKSCAVAEMMEDCGRVLCCDVYEHKLRLAEAQAERLRLSIVETRLLDGRKGDDNLCGKADRVLVDAPCSGLGVVRRKPEIKYRDEAAIGELAETQAQILDRAADYVKKGGRLVYSTCTVNRAENEEQIINFSGAHPEFAIEEQKQLLPTDGTDGFFICSMKRREE